MTTYYVRYIPCGELTADSPTHNEFLWAYSTAVGTYTDIIKRADEPIYGICTTLDVLPDTPRNRTSDIHLDIAYQDDTPATGEALWFNYKENLDDWASYGWTDPNTDRTTFINELCTFFESAKVTDSSIYGEDNNEINLYLISCTYLGATFYFPFFMKGNDSHFDSIVEV